MSQNQSYFWQTTRHNVYLKRSAKLQMLLALLAVLTFSTVCIAEINDIRDNNDVTMGAQTKISEDDSKLVQPDSLDSMDTQNADATKDTTVSKPGFVDAFTASISVILVTELGDKTFFIAAIMAMRHPRLIVFTGAISALALMTVLSVVFGMAATIIPKVYTYYISTALFAIFGLKMIYEGYKMKPSDAQEELEEVQSDLRKREDELMRSKREDSGLDGKRKNSNSDKSDSSAGAATGGGTATTSTHKNPEMQHRQRKQPNTYNNNNNNSNSNNNKNNINNHDVDDEDSIGECTESDVFLENGLLRKHETIKLSTFSSQSSPAISTSALSNQTNQTNCDSYNNSTNDERNTPQRNLLKNNNNNNNNKNKQNNTMTLIHSTSASGNFMNGSTESLSAKHSSIINGDANGVAAGTSLGLDGSKRRLERSATAAVVQDPESGIVRKNSKKGPGYLATRVFMQAFTMTFLAEWGDRSQLTTIILAASKNFYGVITGGIIGHAICTGLAVIGGRMVAAKISVRTVTIVGGIVFLGFALYALIVRPDDI